MTTSPFSIPDGAITRNLKRIVNHWGVLGVALGALTTLFGFVTLSTYFHAIGLPEVLPRALDTKTALIPWMLLVSGLLVAYAFVLIIGSGVFATGLTFFNKQPTHQRDMAIFLMIPTLLGIAVLMIGIAMEFDKPLTFLTTLAAEIIALIVLLRFDKFAVPMHVSGLMAEAENRKNNKSRINGKDRRAGNGWGARFGTVVPIALVVFSTGAMAILPAQFVLSSHGAPVTLTDPIERIETLFITGLLPLGPAFVFFFFQTDLLGRIRNALLTLMAVTIMMLSIAPSTFPSIVYRAAYLMGVRDTKLASYLITDTYSFNNFDGQWGMVTSSGSRPVVKGFPLFSLGDLLVLCPASFVDTDLQDWPGVSQGCLVTDTKTAKRLPMKQAKATKVSPALLST